MNMRKNYVRTRDWKEMRRFRALELKRAGWTHAEVAEALGVTEMAVSKWMKAVREEGKAGLQSCPAKGATPKLSKAKLALLPELLAEGAEAYGFRGAVWTCARVAKVIEWKLGVSYHKDMSHVYSRDWNGHRKSLPCAIVGVMKKRSPIGGMMSGRG
jgi:transposase